MRDRMRKKPTVFSKKIHEIIISVGTSEDDIRVGLFHDWNQISETRVGSSREIGHSTDLDKVEVGRLFGILHYVEYEPHRIVISTPDTTAVMSMGL